MSQSLLAGMNFSLGDRKLAAIKVTGPSSYTAITAGTPPAGPTGGQQIDAAAFGLKFIDFIIGGLDNSGKYNVLATPGGSEEATSVRLMWILAVTGAETSGDLSPYTARLLAIGR